MISKSILFSALISLFTGLVSIEAAAASYGAKPVVDMPVSKIVDYNGVQQAVPDIKTITAEENVSILAKLGTLPGFPENSFSGCHARAHFDYLQLSKVAAEKIYKVWLFSGSLLSPAVQGAVSYVDKNGNKASWDYHVAVAFSDSQGGEWIIDRLIAPTPLKVTDWVSYFDIDGYAVLTRANPEMYLFNKTNVPALDPVNFPNGFLNHFVPKNVFNGSFYTYSGDAANNHWGASDLAADALSSALQQQKFPDCPWVDIASQSLQLKAEIAKSPVSPGCKQAQRLFQNAFKTWITQGL